MRVESEKILKFYWEEDDIQVLNGYICDGDRVVIIYDSVTGMWGLLNATYGFVFHYDFNKCEMAEYINDIGNGDLAPFGWEN
jgi:hypothetical protein